MRGGGGGGTRGQELLARRESLQVERGPYEGLDAVVHAVLAYQGHGDSVRVRDRARVV